MLLAGCGGSSDETTSTPVTEAEDTEDQASSSEAEDQASPSETTTESEQETVDGSREALIAFVTAIQPSDDVPLVFIECWIDKTLELNDYEPAELLRILISEEESQALDENMSDVVFTCIGELSPEDFAAVLESGILDEDTEDAEDAEDARSDEDLDISNFSFPAIDAPDLVNDPAWADPGVEITISPGFTNGYLWSGEISGRGLPAKLGVVIFGCETGTEMEVINRFFEVCDFDQPLFVFTDNLGGCSSSINDPVPYAPSGACLVITTDPDDNHDTDDGQGAIICSETIQILPESDTPDLISSPLYSDPGLEITVSPGIVDGSLWQGIIKGSGFTPGEVVGGIGCAATYETFIDVFPQACDFTNTLLIGIADENGIVESDLFPPTPTVPSGTCLLLGTDPDGNIDTDDGVGTLVCTR